jgi:hypothetical protein
MFFESLDSCPARTDIACRLRSDLSHSCSIRVEAHRMVRSAAGGLHQPGGTEGRSFRKYSCQPLRPSCSLGCRRYRARRRMNWNPFGLYKPASCAVGLYETTGADAEASAPPARCRGRRLLVCSGPRRTAPVEGAVTALLRAAWVLNDFALSIYGLCRAAGSSISLAISQAWPEGSRNAAVRRPQGRSKGPLISSMPRA